MNISLVFRPSIIRGPWIMSTLLLLLTCLFDITYLSGVFRNIWCKSKPLDWHLVCKNLSRFWHQINQIQKDTNVNRICNHFEKLFTLFTFLWKVLTRFLLKIAETLILNQITFEINLIVQTEFEDDWSRTNLKQSWSLKAFTCMSREEL